MPQGRHDDHNHVGVRKGLGNIRGNDCQTTRAGDASFVFYVNRAAGGDFFYVFSGTVIQVCRKTPDGQVGCQCFAAVPRTDNGVAGLFTHNYLFPVIESTATQAPRSSIQVAICP
jgi:hypothetical protein